MSLDFLSEQDKLDINIISPIINSTFQDIQGEKSTQFNQGKAIFTSLTFFSDPNYEAFFKVTSSTIIRYYEEYFHPAGIMNGNLNGEYAFIFSIKFRDCVLGEVFMIKINRSGYFFR